MRQYNIFDIERLAEKRMRGRIKDKNKGLKLNEILETSQANVTTLLSVIRKLRKSEGKKAKYSNEVFVDLVTMIESVENEQGKKNK